MVDTARLHQGDKVVVTCMDGKEYDAEYFAVPIQGFEIHDRNFRWSVPPNDESITGYHERRKEV